MGKRSCTPPLPLSQVFPDLPPAPKVGDRYCREELGCSWVWDGHEWKLNLREHFGLAYKYAKQFSRRYHAEQIDRGLLFIEDSYEWSDALLGLVEAAKRYKAERGIRFSTYAGWWMRQALGHGQANRGEANRPGRKVRGREILFSAFFHDVLRRGTSGGEELALDPADPWDDGMLAPPLFAAWEMLRCLPDDYRRVVFRVVALGETLHAVGDGESPPVCRERIRQMVKMGLRRLRLHVIESRQRGARMMSDREKLAASCRKRVEWLREKVYDLERKPAADGTLGKLLVFRERLREAKEELEAANGLCTKSRPGT